MRTKVPGLIADFSFEGISVAGERADCRFALEGHDEGDMLKNVTISGASLYGEPVKAGDPSCRIGAFAENVVVR